MNFCLGWVLCDADTLMDGFTSSRPNGLYKLDHWAFEFQQLGPKLSMT